MLVETVQNTYTVEVIRQGSLETVTNAYTVETVGEETTLEVVNQQPSVEVLVTETVVQVAPTTYKVETATVNGGTSPPITFEWLSKNLQTYPAELNYTAGVLTSIVYTTLDGTITKTFIYTGGVLTQVNLSGSIPTYIPTTKHFTYSGGVITDISYS